jgi:TonB family protein
MAKKEKFGKFVLLEEIDTSGLGSEYRAAKLSATGLEKLVNLLRLGPALSANVEVAKHLMEQAKVAAQLQNPNIIKIYGIGKVDTIYYISYEFIEGKSLKAIFSRCRQEGFPFSVDHALLIASKICSALEYAHSRKTEGGRYFHGFVNPAHVIVSYEGEVRVGGFGYWPSRIREAGGVNETEASYLAPEQASGGTGDTRSDSFAVGTILFETLTGHPLFEGGRTADVASRLAGARLQSPTGEDDSLPKAIAEILSRSLSVDPAGRYAEIQEMRKAIDTLLFSGDFTPTTFNLAFFMHSLFREDIERESKVLKEEKEGSYLEFLTEDVSKTVVLPKPTSPSTLPLVPPPPKHEPEPRHAPAPPPAAMRDGPSARETRTPLPPSVPPPHEEPPLGVSPKEAAAGFTFHKGEAKGRSPVVPALGAVVLLLLVAGGGFYYYRNATRTPPIPPPTTLSPEALAAEAKVKELQAKVKEMEDEKAAAEQKAKDDATAKLQKEAKAKGTEVDAAALQKAQEEAARKARIEQEKKQEEERRKIEEEKKAEEARLEEQRKIAEAAAAAAVPSPTPTPPPTTLPAVKPGALVNLSDAGVIAPVLDKQASLAYPPLALRQHLEGTVDLNVLVDERGSVTDATVASTGPNSPILAESAIENVKRRKYRPGTKEGVPIKVWIPVRVTFVLPKS